MTRNTQRPAAASDIEDDFSGSQTSDAVGVTVLSAEPPISTTQKWADRWVSRLRSDAAKSNYSASSPLSRG